MAFRRSAVRLRSAPLSCSSRYGIAVAVIGSEPDATVAERSDLRPADVVAITRRFVFCFDETVGVWFDRGHIYQKSLTFMAWDGVRAPVSNRSHAVSMGLLTHELPSDLRGPK